MVSKDLIEKSQFLYDKKHKWIKITIYSSDHYILQLDNNISIKITSKLHYSTMKPIISLIFLINGTFELCSFENLNININQLHILDTGNYLEQLFLNDEKKKAGNNYEKKESR